MTNLYDEPTYFALGRVRETTYGTGIAWASASPVLLKHEELPVWAKPRRIVTDKNIFTGKKGITERDIRSWDVARTHQARLLPDPTILLMALLAGKAAGGTPNVTASQLGGTTAYKHVVPVAPALPEAFSVTGWQANPLTGNKVFAGMTCKSLKISAKEADFVRLSAELVGDGSMAAGVDISAGVAPSGESYLSWEDCDLLIGGTFSGTDVSGGTSIKTLVKQVDLAINGGPETEFQMGGDGDYADAAIIKDLKPENRGVLDLTFKPADTTYLDYLAAETEAVAEFIITGALADTGYYFELSWIFPVGRVMKADPNRDGSIMTADMSIVSLKDDSASDHPEIYFYGQNKATAYLAAA